MDIHLSKPSSYSLGCWIISSLEMSPCMVLFSVCPVSVRWQKNQLRNDYMHGHIQCHSCTHLLSNCSLLIKRKPIMPPWVVRLLDCRCHHAWWHYQLFLIGVIIAGNVTMYDGFYRRPFAQNWAVKKQTRAWMTLNVAIYVIISLLIFMSTDWNRADNKKNGAKMTVFDTMYVNISLLIFYVSSWSFLYFLKTI